MTMELLKYDQAYHELIENYRLSENNLRFTIRPRNAVASKAPSRTHILVMEAGRLVTFFTLDYGEDAQRFAQHDHAILIRSFSTDIRHQGKGYAKKALQLLPQYITKQHTNITDMVLAVNIQNHTAQKLYERCGFLDTYQRCEGRNGPLIIMQKKVVEAKQYT